MVVRHLPEAGTGAEVFARGACPLSTKHEASGATVYPAHLPVERDQRRGPMVVQEAAGLPHVELQVPVPLRSRSAIESASRMSGGSSSPRSWSWRANIARTARGGGSAA